MWRLDNKQIERRRPWHDGWRYIIGLLVRFVKIQEKHWQVWHQHTSPPSYLSLSPLPLSLSPNNGNSRQSVHNRLQHSILPVCTDTQDTTDARPEHVQDIRVYMLPQLSSHKPYAKQNRYHFYAWSPHCPRYLRSLTYVATQQSLHEFCVGISSSNRREEWKACFNPVHKLFICVSAQITRLTSVF